MAQDPQTYRRAANVALFGLIVQVVLTIVMALAGLAVQSPALYAATWHLVGGVPIWIILLILFNQHRLERAEALESEQLARGDAQSTALFDDAADDLRIARRRLNGIYRVGLGATGVIVSAYLLTLGGLYLYKAWSAFGDYTGFIASARNDVSPIGAAVVCIAIIFVAFIVARYEAGMTRIKEYQALRGGAGFLMGNALVALLLAVGLVFAAFENDTPLAFMMLVTPGIMILLGVEVLLSFLLNVYRPRRPGEFPRPAFDSRILGLLTSPKSLAKALSDAINYQFGFEVSSSWFYQLLGRAITPLFVFGLLVLIAMSSFVLVQPHEQALILHSGRIVGQPLGPGLHFKLPWPLNTTQKFEVTRVRQLSVGSSLEGIRTDVPMLWTNVHAMGKEQYLVTAPTAFTEDPGTALTEGVRTPAVSLVGLQMNVQYRIDPTKLLDYALHHDNPVSQLTAISDRAMTHYLAARDIDTIIGRGRITAGEELGKTIQDDADRAGLGLQVVAVTLEGVHPPTEKDVATSFYAQISALQKNQSEIEKARGQATRTLAEVTGTPERARALIKAINDLSAAERDLNEHRTRAPEDAETLEEMERRVVLLEQEIEELLAGARGKAAELIYQARAHRWERSIAQRAVADGFDSKLAAYRGAPKYYRMKTYFDVLAEGLEKSRKIVTTAENQEPPTFDIDLTDSQSAVESIMRPR